MKILVTGSSGFVGSHLVKNLRPHHQVETLDARLVNDESTQWHSQLEDCDVLVHLAGRAHVSSNKSDYEIYKKINCDLTETLARRVSKTKKHLIFVSTAVVYGHKSRHIQPFCVTDTLRPDSPYTASKVAAEKIIRELGQESDLSYTIIRPPLVYGPEVKANFLSMMRWVNSGLPLPLGCAKKPRSFVGIRNLTSLIEECSTNPMAKKQIFNASDDEDCSTRDLLNSIAVELNKSSRLVPIPLGILKLGSQIIGKPRVFDSLCESFQLEMTHTKKTLNWTPPFSFKEEIRSTVSWFKSAQK